VGNEVALYKCEVDEGKSKLEELNVDPYGNIPNWPKDFFGDEMGDLAAMTKAGIQRRRAG
jgi:predicted ATPase